jgi:hypothetical protein
MRGSSGWDSEKDRLTDARPDGRDTFKRLPAMFDL